MKIPVKYKNPVHKEACKRGAAGAGSHGPTKKNKNKKERREAKKFLRKEKVNVDE